MTATHDPTSAYGPEERAADLVLARIHLRLGSLGLARAELETMAGRHALDDEGIIDLAEARWRTGDLPGASDAAVAYLESRPDHPLALVIAAEAQAHLGRPGEARRLAGRALERHDGPIDPLFAGMPRSSVWPADPGAAPEPAGMFFDDEPMPAFGPESSPWARGGAIAEEEPFPAPLVGYEGPGLWDAHEDTVATELPPPAELLDRARTALGGERPGQAAAALALAIRAAPGLAPAVLDLLAGRPEPVLALVRGDAHRIVGHEAEALRDYAAAVAAIGLERRAERVEGDEAGKPTGPDAAAGPAADAGPAAAADAAAADAEPGSVQPPPADGTGEPGWAAPGGPPGSGLGISEDP